MYYNRILRVWVVDSLDYFLLSAILGSILAPRLKDYLSEKKAMQRLKNSIIKKLKLKLVIKSDRPVSNSEEIRIKKIYKFALENRGGQFENSQADHEFFNEVFKLAQEIKGLVERLASFLRERQLKGVARIFFKSGRLILGLILHKCRIDITYSLLSEGLSTQVIIITVVAGGATGFTVSWFSAGASLVAPPLLISMVLIRSVAQNIVNKRDYSKFKKLVNQMLENNELKQTFRAFFIEGEVPTTTDIKMKPWDSDKNPLPEFNIDSDQTFEEFIEARIKKQLGLVENPTPEQLEEIIQKKVTRERKPKGKTVYLKDLIDEIAEDPDGIIDAEIVKEAIRVKVKNEEL
jgi:hypothetical protein